jgi:beta-glucosidase
MTAFPADFTFGAATAAFQIEGAAGEDGRGESIWDRFCRVPGAVRNGDTGDVACDFYHRYRDDIGLMRELGLDAFRFSVAWPRVLPDGRGRVNAAGLDFYDRLVDELLAAGIEPYLTLYHWDLPQALEDEGGWTARSTAEAFAEYAGAVVGRLGDRVRHWMTHNEPWVSAWLGYGVGKLAPGRTGEALAASHHLLLSHGWACEVLRAGAPEADVGIVLNMSPIEPASEDEADVAAAHAFDGVLNRWYCDPLFRGSYPEDILAAAEEPVPVADSDLEAIAAPLDFVGVNYYSRRVVRAGGTAAYPAIVRVDGAEHTAMDWEVHPDGLYDLLSRLARDYSPAAIHVTENGAAFGDVRGHDGSVRDPERTEYIARHLDAVARAAAAGVPVRGYFAWSLLDNFEWSFGYSKRFGIVYVDYPTLERVPKESFYAYRDAIAAARSAAGVA